MKLIAIPGTSSDQSTNRTLLQYMQKRYGDQADIEILEIKDWPMFTKSQDRSLPDAVVEAADKIKAADGVVISTPEYNHSFPAALTSALGWLSYGIYPFVNKPVLIVGASYGRLGSSRAQAQLRSALNAEELQARKMPANEFLLGYSLDAFDEEGNLVYENKVNELDEVFHNFCDFMTMSKKFEGRAAVVKNEDKFNWE